MVELDFRKYNGEHYKEVYDLLGGNYIVSNNGGLEEGDDINKKVGDKWKDSDGVEWEQREGYRSKVSHLAAKGLGDNCSNEECGKLIIKAWDKDTYKADGRCYHCQLNFELDLQFDKPIRWFAYRRLKDFKNMKSIERDLEQWVEERHKMLQENPFPLFLKLDL